MTRYEFDAMPMIQATMHCWACGGEHNWSKRWATFIDDRDPVPEVKVKVPVTGPRRGREQFRTR